jgi:hypothetical protein
VSTRVQHRSLQLSAEGVSKCVQPIRSKQRQHRGNRLATANGARDRRTSQHDGREERELDAVGPSVLDLQASETVCVRIGVSNCFRFLCKTWRKPTKSADGDASNDGRLASRASEADNSARRRQRGENKRGELQTLGALC